MPISHDRDPSYNAHPRWRGGDHGRRGRETHVSDATKKALEEIDHVSSWDEFVEICEEQRRRRGW